MIIKNFLLKNTEMPFTTILIRERRNKERNKLKSKLYHLSLLPLLAINLAINIHPPPILAATSAAAIIILVVIIATVTTIHLETITVIITTIQQITIILLTIIIA